MTIINNFYGFVYSSVYIEYRFNYNMNQSDIKEVVRLLKLGRKFEDWDSVDEALEYIIEYMDDVDLDDQT